MKPNPPAMRPTMRMYQRQRTRTRSVWRQHIIISSSIVVALAMGFILFINLSDTRQTLAAANGDYRSKASGNWNAPDTWEKYSGTNWTPATASPTSSDGAITILSGHTVTVTASVKADQVTVDAGGTLTLSTEIFSLSNGTGDDMIVNGTLNINKTLALLASYRLWRRSPRWSFSPWIARCRGRF